MSLGAGCLAGPHLANLTLYPFLPRLTPPETWHPKVLGPCTCPSLTGCMPLLPETAQTGMPSQLLPANLNCAHPSQANSRLFVCHKNFLGCLAHIPTLSSRGLWYFSLIPILGLCYTESNSGTQRKYTVYKPMITPKLQGFFYVCLV